MTSPTKPCAIINAMSGSTTDITGPLKAKLSEKYDDVGPVLYLDPAKMSDQIEEAIADGCDLVIVYGGDGTALTAAKLATAKEIPIVALPGGTMNLLPKALYDTEDWEAALDKALTCDEPRWMAAGSANGEMFLCGCMIGTPARLNDVREQLRSRSLMKAAEDLVFNLMDFQTDDTFEYAVGGRPGAYRSANLLNIVCPQTSDHVSGKGALEVNAIDVDSVGDILGLGLSALASEWRDDDASDMRLTDRVHIKGSGKIEILLDGEAHDMRLPLEITLNRKGVFVLAP